MRAILLSAVGLLFLPGDRQVEKPLTSSFVLAPTCAYFLAPSKLLSEGKVEYVEYSPDGRYALVSGSTKPGSSAQDELKKALDPQKVAGEPWLKVWDLKSGVLRDVPRSLLTYLHENPGRMEFTTVPNVMLVRSLPGLPTASRGGRPPSFTVDKVNLIDGSVKRILSLEQEPDSYADMEVSPGQPFLVVLKYERNRPVDVTGHKTTVSFQKVDFNGNVVKSGKARLEGRAVLMGWTKDGAHMVGSVSRVESVGKRPIAKTLVANFTTGVVSETTEPVPTFGEDENGPGLTSILADGATKVGGKVVPYKNLWIVADPSPEKGPAFVAADVDEAWLSPKAQVIAYTVEGRLFARVLLQVDLDSYKKALEDAERQEAVNKVKQIATGIMMYCADYDDMYPPSGEIKDTVGPYVKSLSMFDGFVYTFSGKNATDIAQPASTEIGYLPIAGGRCVAYADGHVNFIPNP